MGHSAARQLTFLVDGSSQATYTELLLADLIVTFFRRTSSPLLPPSFLPPSFSFSSDLYQVSIIASTVKK